MYSYKTINNMTKEDAKEFAENPHEWAQQQLKNAVNHDPIVFKCYEIFMQISEDKNKNLFEDIKFLTLLAHMALIAHSACHEQLLDIFNNLKYPKNNGTN